MLDGEYRKEWDESFIENYEVGRLDGNNDIGYYSSESFDYYSTVVEACVTK